MEDTKDLSDDVEGSENSTVETGWGLRVVVIGPAEKDEADSG